MSLRATAGSAAIREASRDGRSPTWRSSSILLRRSTPRNDTRDNPDNLNAAPLTQDPENDISEAVFREILLPEIEREVNHGKNFAPLRQIFHSMILATWYKRNMTGGMLGQVYANRNKIQGIQLRDKNMKEAVYQRYVEAFERGVYNYIREDFDETAQRVIPRKYFSGGISADHLKMQRVDVLEDLVASPVTVTFQDVGAAPVGKVIPSAEMKRRYARYSRKDKNILLGFMRDGAGKIQPVFSGSAEFKSHRRGLEFDGSLMRLIGGHWVPDREIRDIPLLFLGAGDGVRFDKVRKSADWPFLPDDLKEILDSGNLLVTAGPDARKSRYSLLMAVNLSGGPGREEGRSGVLMRDGMPVVIDIDGKEFVLEVKGVGNVDGGYDLKETKLLGGAKEIMLRGVGQVEETSGEWAGLESQRRTTRFSQGRTVRAVTDIWFSLDGRRQGYLLRLSPGSIRGSYSENDAFEFNRQGAAVTRMAYDLGRQMGERLGAGFVPSTHPENLVAVNSGEEYILTDYSDVLPIYSFPREIESEVYDLFELLESSLGSVDQIPGYGQYQGFDAFRVGLAEGLLASGLIAEVDLDIFGSLRNFLQIRDFLWQRSLAAHLYKARTVHGWTPSIINLIEEYPAGVEVSQEELERKARVRHAKNKQDLAEGRELWKGFLKGLRAEIALLEGTGFTREGFVAVSESEAARQDYAKDLASTGGRTSLGYSAIWSLWGSASVHIVYMLKHLQEEERFLSLVAESIDNELKGEVVWNLEIVRQRIAQLEAMTPYDYYLASLENPDFSRQMSLLPYFSKESSVSVQGRGEGLSSPVPSGEKIQTPGGIDLDAGHLDLRVQGQGDGLHPGGRGIQLFKDSDVEGFVPVIIHVAPPVNVPLFLNVSGRRDGPVPQHTSLDPQLSLVP